MIACLLIPGFELRAALRKQPGLALRPAALSPVAGMEPVLGPVTAEAERLGVRPGMRLGEALAMCPGRGNGCGEDDDLAPVVRGRQIVDRTPGEA